MPQISNSLYTPPKIMELNNILRREGINNRIARGMAKAASTIVVPEMPYSSIPGMQMDSGDYYFTKSAAEIAEGYHMNETIEEMEKAGDIKTSDIEKEVPGRVEDVIKEDPDKNFRLKGLRIAMHAEEPIPTDILNSMAATYSLEDIIGTLLSLGVIPTPKEFQRSVLCSCGQKSYADALDEKGLVFDTDMPVKESTMFGPANITFNAILAEEIGKSGILEKRSYWPQHLAKRASLIKQAVSQGEFFEKYPVKKNPTPIRKIPEDMQEQVIARGINRSDLVSRRTNPNVIIGDQSRYVPALPEGMTQKRDANPLIPIAALAALYAGVEFMAGTTQSPLGIAMRKDPRIAAGVFGAAAALTWIGRKIGIRPQPVVRDRPKTASVPLSGLKQGIQVADDIILQTLAGIALAYALAGREEEKRSVGAQPNLVEEAFHKRPILGAAFSTAAIRGAINAAKKLAQPVEDIDKSLIPELDKMADAIAYNGQLADTFSIQALDEFARNSLTLSAERLLNNTPWE